MMAETVAPKAKVQYMVQDTSWFRICADCGFKQSEDWDFNDICENCGGEAILSMPLNSGYEGMEI